jgi:MHS family proline/betaine transporter-like MFS transporter
MPISGYLSDKLGRKLVLRYSAIAIALSAYPVFYLLTTGSFQNALLGQVIFGIFLGFYLAPVPATLVELFPTSVRFTGLALSYNISAAIFESCSCLLYYVFRRANSACVNRLQG